MSALALADICSAKGRVRFAPNSDRESEFPQKVMSGLPPKADILRGTRHVALCVVYFASIAVTSTSIIMYGQAS
jgi:hypothetical protein